MQKKIVGNIRKENFPIEKSGKVLSNITRGKIIFDHISFHYEKDKPILKDINLHIAPGEIIGITGANYSGKSTLLELILGFYTPVDGEVRIDGKKLLTTTK